MTDQRTAKDFAHILKDLSDTYFPAAAKIALVQDNLNTHRPASLYEAFPPAEARLPRDNQDERATDGLYVVRTSLR